MHTRSARRTSPRTDWLSAHGYHPVSLSQLITASQGGAPLPPKPVLLTFDDGLRSVYTKVFCCCAPTTTRRWWR